MTSPSGLSATWLNYGATLQKLICPDGTNVVLGFDDPFAYLNNPAFLGGTIGPVANRIRGGAFALGNKTYHTDPDDGPNTLHGGSAGFHKKTWDYAVEGDALGFFLDLEDGDGGFPGQREVSLIIHLADNALRVEWAVETDKDTVLNMTLHPYFNMSGDPDQPIDNHALQSDASHFIPHDAAHAPIGEMINVAGTNLDFTDPDEVGSRVIDHHLMVPGGQLRELAALTDGVRTLFVNSDAPGFQLFTGETLGDAGFVPRAGLAIEPQFPPDDINQRGDESETILKAGDTAHGIIEYILHGPGLPR